MQAEGQDRAGAEFKVVGTRPGAARRRRQGDGPGQVRRRLAMPGQLVGKVLRSPHRTRASAASMTPRRRRRCPA